MRLTMMLIVITMRIYFTVWLMGKHYPKRAAHTKQKATQATTP